MRFFVVAAAALAVLVSGSALAHDSHGVVHEVSMEIVFVDYRPLPEFFFEPTGLLIQPGDTVRFIANSPHHTATAYHAQHIKSHRVPDGVEPFSSPIVPIGEDWEYTFTVPGTYDIWCGPHEQYGMVMRIVVGEPDGPANEPVTEFGPDGVYGAAVAILSDPALNPLNIVAVGAVHWADISDEAKSLE